MMASTPEISVVDLRPSTPPFLYLNPHFTPRRDDSDESLELGLGQSTSAPPTNSEPLPTNVGAEKKDKVRCLLCSKWTSALPKKHMHKFVRKLLHHVRCEMGNLPENLEEYPFCTGCEELLQTVWFGYQNINEGINRIQGKVAQVARMQAGQTEVPTGTEGRVKLLEALVQVFCRNLSFSEKISHDSTQAGCRRGRQLGMHDEDDESDEQVDIVAIDESEEEVEDSFNTKPSQAQLMFGIVTEREERPEASDDGDKQPQNMLSSSTKLDGARDEAKRKRRRKNTRNPYKIKKRLSSPKSGTQTNGNGEGTSGKASCSRLLRNKANLTRRKSCFCCAKMETGRAKNVPTGTTTSNSNLKVMRQ